MNDTAKSFTVWTDQPRRTGLAWAWGNGTRLLRQIQVYVLTRFISLLGTLSTPGMRLVGPLQAWALRCMGVQCPSSDVWVGPHSAFDYPQNITLGRRVVLGADTRITARDEVVIGDDFLSAPGLHINTGTHDPVTLVPQSAPITIGPGVWCGIRVTICAGVTIGRGAVIGAASLVLRDIPPGHVAHGVPCKPRAIITMLPSSARWSNFRREPGDPS
ncbi:MAG TPA: hypothetical protein VFJ90_02485 [Candidatus Didemnitutus sp.]|nr:hypothetical protein [Candidatus Didemnitutus sp.]